MYVLLNKAQRDFHDMFTRTYGVMYQRNAEVFQNYFKDLKLYYDKGILNPVDSTNSFFNALYQKMFQVMLKTGDSNFLFRRIFSPNCGKIFYAHFRVNKDSIRILKKTYLFYPDLN